MMMQVNAAGARLARFQSRDAGAASVPVAAALLALVAATAGLLAVTGDPRLAVLPLAAIAVTYALFATPLRFLLIGYSTMAWMVSLLPRLLSGRLETWWKSPMYPVYLFLSDNLSKTTGIEALRLSGSEALYLCILFLLLLRWLTRPSVPAPRTAGARILIASLWVSFAAVVWLEVWGLAHGGDFRQSLWQFRALFWLPVLVTLFGYSLEGPRDFPLVVYAMTVAACVKIGFGLFYMITIAWPNAYAPESMTGHEDSPLFVAVTLAWLAAWIHRPRLRTLPLTLLVVGWVLIGMVVNNRRIAFVELAVGLLFLYLFLGGPVKRLTNRALLVLLPAVALYLAVGMSRPRGIFKPAALIMSVSKQTDGSSLTRDIENFNLIQTLKPVKVLGSGWGHEYNEVVKADDISKYFAQYRYVAHNSILWLLSIGGIVGFTLLWMPVSIGVFLAARSYRFAANPLERTAAITGLAILSSYVVQSWGDMGTQGAFSGLVVAWGLATVARLATHTGAWPSTIGLIAPRRTRAAQRGPSERRVAGDTR